MLCVILMLLLLVMLLLLAGTTTSAASTTKYLWNPMHCSTAQQGLRQSCAVAVAC
jgi:hypothetical protein